MKNKIFKGLTLWIVMGLIAGIIAGLIVNKSASHDTAIVYSNNVNYITTIFLRLVKMIIAPLIVSTLTVGIAKMGDPKTLGRVFTKTIILFLIAAFISLVLGLILVDLYKPGVGMHFQAELGLTSVGGISAESGMTIQKFIEFAIPSSVLDAMSTNSILQIVVFSLFFGCGLAVLGDMGKPLIKVMDVVAHTMFKVTGYIMIMAPLVVFAAISSVVAQRGPGILIDYGIFMGEFYTCLLAVWIVCVGCTMLIAGKETSKLAKAIVEPVILAFTTASSEAAFPGTLQKLEIFGVSNKISSFVLPIGYSFNLCGSNVYMTFAVMFIAQACDIPIPFSTQITMVLILMLTSKGIAGVPRASLVVIAATLQQFHLPEAGLALILGVDPFLDMGRSATSVMSNAMGAAIIGHWEGERYVDVDMNRTVDEQLEKEIQDLDIV